MIWCAVCVSRQHQHTAQMRVYIYTQRGGGHEMICVRVVGRLCKCAQAIFCTSLILGAL